MAHCMSWTVQEVERSVAEVVECFKASDSNGIRAVKPNLTKLTSSDRLADGLVMTDCLKIWGYSLPVTFLQR